MPRMSVPMRVRRRQSDAKWRASVATCYDTLKHIIPNNEKMSKRKISKALILSQTEKHIENLENTLNDLLFKKARSRNKAVLYENDMGMVEANLDDIKHDFSLRQKPFYLQSSMQRKKSSIPSDVETGLVNLRSAICNLTVIPSECLSQQVVPDIRKNKLTSNKHSSSSVKNKNMKTSHTVTEKPDAEVPVIHISDDHVVRGQSVIVLNVDDHNNIQSMEIEEEAPFLSTMESLLNTPVKTKKLPMNRERKKRAPAIIQISKNDSEEMENIESVCLTPFKTKCRHKGTQITPSRGEQRIGNKCRSLTPLKVKKQSPHVNGSNTTGFTPIKLPDDLVFDTPSKLQGSPMFTTWSFMGTPGSSDKYLDEELDSEEIDVASLLCTEDINQMDLGDEETSDDNYKTPYNQDISKFHRDKPIDQPAKKTRLSSLSPDYGKRNIKSESRCRRQLEKLFPKEDPDKREDLPVVSGVFENTDGDCFDFDGYFLFYQHVAGTGKDLKPTPEMTSKVSHMWQKMSEDDRNAFVAMAALENSQSDSSNLSEDLLDLKMEPLSKDENIEENIDIFNQNETSSQEVPDIESLLANQMNDSFISANQNEAEQLQAKHEKVVVMPTDHVPENVLFSCCDNFGAQFVPDGGAVEPQIIEIETEILHSPSKIEFSTVDELELFTLSYGQKCHNSPDVVEELVDQDWNSQIVPDFDFASFEESIA